MIIWAGILRVYAFNRYLQTANNTTGCESITNLGTTEFRVSLANHSGQYNR